MTDRIIDIISKSFPLQKIETNPKTVKASGMKFNISAYEAKGLGHISVMKASGFFGLMKMDTVIVNATECDMPLMSYDRIYAAGRDTLILELYDTMLSSCELPLINDVLSEGSSISDRDPGVHWYDDIRRAESISKCGKSSKFSEKLDALTLSYVGAYLNTARLARECDRDEKILKASVYVEGLISHGGPSTDAFKKSLGDAATAKLFRNVLFGTTK